MDWRMFNIPITTQTETLLPLRPPNFTAPPISMNSPRPVSPLRNSITGLSGFATQFPLRSNRVRSGRPEVKGPIFTAFNGGPAGRIDRLDFVTNQLAAGRPVGLSGFACPSQPSGVSGWWDETFAAVFVDPEDKANIEASDAKLKQLNEEALARGAITPAVYEITSKHIEDSDYESIINDPEMSVFRGFVDGAEEGLLNDLQVAKEAVSKVSSGIFGAIPTGVYITVGVALLALYLIKKK